MLLQKKWYSALSVIQLYNSYIVILMLWGRIMMYLEKA